MIAICQRRDKNYNDKFFLCVKSTKIGGIANKVKLLELERGYE